MIYFIVWIAFMVFFSLTGYFGITTYLFVFGVIFFGFWKLWRFIKKSLYILNFELDNRVWLIYK